MDTDRLKLLLDSVKKGTLPVEDALAELKTLPFEDLEYAKVDHHRALRQGYPEVIFCQGKTIDQIRGIVARMAEKNSTILATRADRHIYETLASDHTEIFYSDPARIIIIGKRPPTDNGKILVMTAGTSDIPVAEEAALTAEVYGNRVDRVFDVGVSGIHRLFSHMDLIAEAKVIVAVAGMEGALPSILGGLADIPVIAVPTSVGYGANFQGLSALLTMLNTCAPGVTVVNIDNGFGAGYFASMVNQPGDK